MPQILKLSLLFSLMVLVVSAKASDEFNLKQMVNRPSRPTVSEVYQALGGAWPAKNPVVFRNFNSETRFMAGRKFRVEGSQKAMNNFLMKNLPRTIARMESLFPNAIWALLGRDSVLLADALEAYYLSIGQKDRVVRIDMSTESFKTPTELIAEYLQSLGAPMDPLKASASKPWIVIDRTSFGGISWHVSGARRVVEIIYDKYIANGGNPAYFAKSVNALTLHPGNGNSENGPYVIPFEETSRDAYLASLKPGFPEKIIGIDSLISDGMEWHNAFQQLIKDERGQVKPVPGPSIYKKIREQIVWEIINSGILISSAEFRSKLDEEFLKLGLPASLHFKKCTAILDRTF